MPILLKTVSSSAAYVGIEADANPVGGGVAATYTLTRTGDPSSALTVPIAVDDPGAVMRGNHWDTALTLPFRASENAPTFALTTRGDQRDLTDPKLPVSVAGWDAGGGKGAEVVSLDMTGSDTGGFSADRRNTRQLHSIERGA